MRIAVFGNCCAPGIAKAMQVMSPKNEVKSVSIWHMDTNNPLHVDTLLNYFDIVFPFGEVSNYPLIDAKIKDIEHRFQWPIVLFWGFHPDIAYFAINGKPVNSGLKGFNSRLVAFAYGHGLSVQTTAELFNALVYGRLGYYDAYPLSRQVFLDVAKQHELDLTAAFAKWEASGVFMHTSNHPSVQVLNDMAYELMHAANLPIETEIDHAEDAEDDLSSGVVWPVYPELAKRIGVKGSLDFRAGTDDGNKIFGLEEYIALSFKQYADDGFTPEQFRATGLYEFVKSKLDFV